MAWLLSLGAVWGYNDRSLSRNPRWLKFCARAGKHNSAGKSAHASLSTPKSLQRKILILHRQIVFQLLQLQHRPALAIGVVHFHGSRRPDAADVLDVAVMNTANEFVFGIALYLGGDVVVFTNPNQRRRIMRRF